MADTLLSTCEMLITTHAKLFIIHVYKSGACVMVTSVFLTHFLSEIPLSVVPSGQVMTAGVPSYTAPSGDTASQYGPSQAFFFYAHNTLCKIFQ